MYIFKKISGLVLMTDLKYVSQTRISFPDTVTYVEATSFHRFKGSKQELVTADRDGHFQTPLPGTGRPRCVLL